MAWAAHRVASDPLRRRSRDLARNRVPKRASVDRGLGLAAAMLLTLAFGLVGVGRNPALLRLVAGAAFLFLALMFLLSFADLMTRLR